MGTENRKAWTVICYYVNLASRLEGMTKQYRVRVLISEYTYRQVKNEFVCRELDTIRVKGKLQPVGIFQLLDFAKNQSKHADLLRLYEEAMALYWRREWHEAAEKF